MARSLKKGPFVDAYLLKKEEAISEKKQVIKTWSRRSTIFPQFIGHTFAEKKKKNHSNHPPHQENLQQLED